MAIKQSFAWRLAKKMDVVSVGAPDVPIYGATKGVLPGQIRSFALAQGPGSHVQWKTKKGKNPTSETPSYRSQYVAAIAEGFYKLICKYEIKSGQAIFTYDCLYSGG